MKMLRVKVKPNCKKQEIRTADDGSWIVCLKSPPVDGKANEELVKVLAKAFKVPKSSVQIKTGQTSRQKLVEIDDS